MSLELILEKLPNIEPSIFEHKSALSVLLPILKLSIIHISI